MSWLICFACDCATPTHSTFTTFIASRELMSDHADVIADGWYWEAFEELDAQGHLNPASVKANAGDAHARLSADGRLYLRAAGES